MSEQFTDVVEEIFKKKQFKCDRCNLEIRRNWRFCPRCGNRLLLLLRKELEDRFPIRKCPDCREVLGENWSFCARCGERLKK